MVKNYSPFKNFRIIFTKSSFLLLAYLCLSVGMIHAQTSDLSITKTVNNATPNVGDQIMFTITVSNAGPDIATGVTIRDVLPSGYSGLTSISGGGSSTGSTVLWPGLTIPVTNSPGDEIVLTLMATVAATGEYNNRAEIIASDNIDPDSDPSLSFDTDDGRDGTPDLIDDDETGLVIVSPTIADVSITKEVELLDANLINGRPHQGTNVIFTITVTNNGPSDTQNVSVLDQLPAGYIYVSDDGFGDYDTASGVWTVGDLVDGASSTLTITAVIGLEDDYVNTAEITNSDSFDPDLTNNQDSASIDPIDVFIPQAFSPNDDSVNDTFEIPGLALLYPDFKIEIFTRWGNKVFEYENRGRTSPQWWDGFSNGNLNFNGSKQVPSGTYYYILYFNQDNIAPISNWVYLNR